MLESGRSKVDSRTLTISWSFQESSSKASSYSLLPEQLGTLASYLPSTSGVYRLLGRTLPLYQESTGTQLSQPELSPGVYRNSIESTGTLFLAPILEPRSRAPCESGDLEDLTTGPSTHLSINNV